jgi:PKD repeat protein
VLDFTYINGGNYIAVLRVTDDDGDSDEELLNIYVNAPPSAVGTATPEYSNAPATVNFSAGGSADSDGSIVSYEWDFGAGFQPSADGTASQSYPAGGTYNATLRVTDNEGGQSIDVVFVYVNSAPVAALSADPLSGSVPLTVNFDASDSFDPAPGAIVKYEWDFDGNGSYDLDSGATATASHEYSDPGSYTAVVRVTDNGWPGQGVPGLSDTASVSIEAEVPPVATEWARTLGFSGVEEARGCTTDAAGNVYIAGYAAASGQAGEFGGKDVLLAKYDAGGVLQPGWPKRWGGASDDEAYDIELDPSGNILVAGISSSFPWGDTGGRDLFAIKFDALGTLLWQKTVGTPGTESVDGQCLTVDEEGNVYLGCTTNWEGTSTSICKLSGSSGSLLWAKLIGGQTGHSFGAITVNPDGVYALGIRADGGGYSWNNLWLFKMSRSTGSGLWQKQLQIAGDHFTEARGLAWTYVGGVERVYGTASIVTSRKDGYIFSVAGNGGGAVTGRRWTDTYGKSIRGVAVDSAGNVIASASSGSGANSICLFKFDSNLNALAREHWVGTAQGDVGQVCISPTDDKPVVVGADLNNSGSWESFSPSIQDQGAAYFDNTAILNSFMNFRTASGTLQTASGFVEDSGAGGNEMFVSKREMGYFAPNAIPIAGLSGSPLSGSAPLTVNFDASASYDSDGSIVKYEWDWTNDGSWDYDSGTDPTVAHNYSAAGEYDALVRVTDNDGSQSVSNSVHVSVTAPIGDWWHTWGGANIEKPKDVEVAADGFVYMVGDKGDAALITKHGLDGVFQWAREWSSPNAVSPSFEEVSMGPDGALYIAGAARYTTPALDQQGILIKLDAAGNLIWQRHWGATTAIASDAFTSIAVSSAGQVYCAGTAIMSGSWNQCLVCFDTAGNQVWQKCWGSPDEDRATGVALDSGGNIYVGGHHGGYPTGLQTVFKFDSAGNVLWSRILSPSGGARASGICVNGAGEVFVTGVTDAVGAGGLDVYIGKLYSDGSLFGIRCWGGPGHEWEHNGIDLAPGGQICIATASNSFGGAAFVEFDPATLLPTMQMAWNKLELNSAVSLDFDLAGGLLMVGNSVNASAGSWYGISGTVSTPGGAFTSGTPTYSSFTPTASASAADGSVSAASGVIDTGGGLRDFAVLRRIL